MIAQNDRRAGPEATFDFGNWDGYRAQRRRILQFLAARRTANPVVLTGDRYATWISDLKLDFDDPGSPTVGAELTGPSISSGRDGLSAAFHAVYDPIKAESLHWKYIEDRRGYVLCDLGRDRMLSELRYVSTVLQPEGTTITTAARLLTEDGRPGVEVEVVE